MTTNMFRNDSGTGKPNNAVVAAAFRTLATTTPANGLATGTSKIGMGLKLMTKPTRRPVLLTYPNDRAASASTRCTSVNTAPNAAGVSGQAGRRTTGAATHILGN